MELPSNCLPRQWLLGFFTEGAKVITCLRQGLKFTVLVALYGFVWLLTNRIEEKIIYLYAIDLHDTLLKDVEHVI
jgi:hypothetical protein